MKNNSVRITDNKFEARDVLRALSDDIGKENILGCVNSNGQWIVTLKETTDVELLQEAGVLIDGVGYEVRGVTRNLLTVSLFGVPVFIDDDELSDKLREFGCILKSAWTHKTYEDFPNVENGIRYIRLELPSNAKSLPYSIFISGVHLRLKHNGQSRVCNICLSSDHIMRECKQYTCKECGMQGHSESKCPRVKCYRCQQFGHKSFDCPTTPPTPKEDNNTSEMETNDSACAEQDNTTIQDIPDNPQPRETIETDKQTPAENENKPSRKINSSQPKPRNNETTDPATQNTEKEDNSTSQKRNLSSDDDWTVQTRKMKNNKKKADPTPNLAKARHFQPRQPSLEQH